MKWFAECKTAEDAKKRYHELAMKHHPDLGGDEATMKAINAEYDRVWERLKSIHINKDGETYTAETTEAPEKFRDIIEQLIHLPNIIIEVVGAWVWVSGNTQPIHERLHDLGFHWSNARKMWYYSEKLGKRKKRGSGDKFDVLRDVYGSVKYHSDGRVVEVRELEAASA